MKTIFLGQVGLRLGQYYSWNGWGDQSGHDYTNPYGGITPEQRLLQNAQESMNAPPPPTPEQQLLQSHDLGPGGELISAAEACYTCSNGSDIQTVKGSAAAEALRKQGYSCKKTECESRGVVQSFSGYGGFYGGPATSGSVETGTSSGGFTSFGGSMMAGRRSIRLLGGIGRRALA